ncbi:aryl-alcohol dehydrogenase-like predicted oxidoreductase [Pedobacter cryoconitis]|uniref:Aryl-alcohol dehydrogenase-like predicted oxidoreductase n=1 Tax=Pedobacter cryoconitis TaxID=188932 RepID=A0A7W9DYU9_9SPHI|nr:aldo/keto reductase [Pedobacter cryoconitis]MBB5635574.1 aryl-alcohol dehydrogenase-like predicted oxidoreductase [Pedobacter cryoconitis]
MKYKLFGTQSGLPASELVLGAASFGERRGHGANAGEISKILAAYKDAGGNFIDVADQYQLGEAEAIVGEFIKSQRHNFIICTKYTRSSETNPEPANLGNHRKVIRQSVDASLKRLNTDYIDIYMPHYDDGVTPLEETIRGLEDLVKSGKILYTGLANFPAWKASAIASIIPLTALQIEYNLVQRAADRELMTMATHFGLGTMLYSPLAGGLLTGKYRKGDTGRLTQSAQGSFKEDIATKTIIDQLELIAAEVQATPGQVALAWTLTKNAFPIVGARTLTHLTDNLKALNIRLSHDQVERLESVSRITLGYPHDLLKTVQKIY